MPAPVPDQRILAGSAATLSWQYLDQDGEPADPGTVTVGVTRADGTAVVATGTATTGTGANPREVSLTPTQTATLDLLTATWTRTTDSVEYHTRIAVVGGFYFTLAAARASDPVLADDVKYTAAVIQAARSEIENEFEAICEVAFVPSHRRETLDGPGTGQLLLPTPLPRRVLAVTELADDGTETAWPAADIAAIRPDETGLVFSPRTFPCGNRNVIVAWEHGWDQPPPDVRQAALLRLRHRVTRPRSAVPDRATTFQIEGGNVYRLDTANARGTGIPDIDAVLDRFSWATPGVA